MVYFSIIIVVYFSIIIYTCENEEIRFPYFSMFSLVDDAESDPS